MPAQEAVAMIFVSVSFFVGIWGVTDTILKHRREMAAMKNGRDTDRLRSEKAELIEKVEHMADRLAVLERIATDPAAKTAAEIEKLR